MFWQLQVLRRKRPKEINELLAVGGKALSTCRVGVMVSDQLAFSCPFPRRHGHTGRPNTSASIGFGGGPGEECECGCRLTSTVVWFLMNKVLLRLSGR